MATLEQIRQLDHFLQAMREADVPVAPGQDSRHLSPLKLPSVVDPEKESATARDHNIETEFSEPSDSSNSHTTQLLKLGLSSDSIPRGFQAHSQHAQRLIQLNRQLSASLVYPLIICLMSLVFLCHFRLCTIPLLIQIQSEPLIQNAVHGDSPKSGLGGLTFAAALILILCIALMTLWMVALARSRRSDPLSPGAIRFLPGARAIIRDSLLTEIAAQAGTLCRKGVPIRSAIQQSSLALTNSELESPPPFLNWITKTARPNAGGFESQLALAADLYQERAQHGAERLRWAIPMFFLAIVSGGAALLYGYLVWSPFCQIMTQISEATIPI